MRCAVLIAVLLAGCGRLGFDALTGGDDASDEDAVDDDVPDDELPDDDLPDDDMSMDQMPMDSMAADASMACGTGHNEDGDAFADSCDRCPHIFTTTNLDGDEDGVGDDCDPQVGTPNQSIVRFDTFVNLPADWNVTNTATIVGESLVVGGPGGNSISRPWANGNSLFVIGFTAATPSGAALLSINAGEMSTPRLYYCELYDDTLGMLLQLTYTLDGTNYMHPGFQANGERLAGLAGTLEMSTGTIKRCHSETAAGGQTAGGTVNGVAPDTLAVYAENVTATIAWMIEIRTSP